MNETWPLRFVADEGSAVWHALLQSPEGEATPTCRPMMRALCGQAAPLQEVGTVLPPPWGWRGAVGFWPYVAERPALDGRVCARCRRYPVARSALAAYVRTLALAASDAWEDWYVNDGGDCCPPDEHREWLEGRAEAAEQEWSRVRYAWLGESA